MPAGVRDIHVERFREGRVRAGGYLPPSGDAWSHGEALEMVRLEVIGLVADARIAEPHAMNQQFLFTALLQEPARSLERQPPYLWLKSQLAPNAVAAQARRTLVALGRDDIVNAHRLQRTLDAALLRERVMRLGAFYFAGVTLLLENLNVEPPEAEVHYMGHSVEELSVVFEQIPASGLKWAFSANHMHLLPGDFDSFVDAFGVERIGLVLTAENRGQWEEHLVPGQGTFDFRRLFGRLEGDGYRGPYMLTFGSREQKLAGREYLLAQAGQG